MCLKLLMRAKRLHGVFSLPQLVQEVCVERQWGQKGSPWELNLRDMFRWCQLMQADQSPGFFSPGQHVALVYADRMRTEADKAQVICCPNAAVITGVPLNFISIGSYCV